MYVVLPTPIEQSLILDGATEKVFKFIIPVKSIYNQNVLLKEQIYFGIIGFK
jgi:hypothetical protein